LKQDSISSNELPDFASIPDLLPLFIKQLTKDFDAANFDTEFILNIEKNSHQIQSIVEEELNKKENQVKSKLNNLLYRIDISELEIKKLCSKKPRSNFNEILSELIIKRILQKVVFKEFYKKKQ
jgi:hypothetical protein